MIDGLLGIEKERIAQWLDPEKILTKWILVDFKNFHWKWPNFDQTRDFYFDQ